MRKYVCLSTTTYISLLCTEYNISMTPRGHTEFHSPFNEIKEPMATGLRPCTDSNSVSWSPFLLSDLGPTTLKPFGQPWDPTEEPETCTRYAILALKIPFFLLEGDKPGHWRIIIPDQNTSPHIGPHRLTEWL